MRRSAAALSELRAHTAAVHRRLHDQPDFRRLQDGVLDHAGYRALLRRLWGFHAPLEAAIRAAWPQGSGLLDLPARERAPLLAADLAHLGDGADALAALPRCRALPPVAGEGHLVGCLYVVEGAGLGGQVLARHLDGLLGGAADGRRFFLGRRPDPWPWPRMLALIEASGAGGHLPAMVEAATLTFAAFDAWLNPPGPAAKPAGAVQ